MEDNNHNKRNKRKRSSSSVEKDFKRMSEASSSNQKVDLLYTVPPGLVKEKTKKPEDAIPDLPENKSARDFLKIAPTSGLWMPLGKEVKVMQCWRCKAYGHRTGDRECPLRMAGNPEIESARQAREDPMTQYLAEQSKNIEKKETKTSSIKQWLELLKKEKAKKKKRKKKKHKASRDTKEKKKKSGRKRKRSHSSDSSDSSRSSPSPRHHRHDRKNKHKHKHKHKHRHKRDSHSESKRKKRRKERK